MQSTVEFYFSRAKSVVDITDDALLGNIKQGNQQSFSRLYNKYVQQLFNYGMHACNDPGLVKNCLQELFVQVWDQRYALGVATSVKSYLFKSFRKLLSKRIFTGKNLSARFTCVFGRQFEFILLTDNLFIKHMDPAIEIDQVKQIFRGLTNGQREIFFLKFNSMLSYHEVASIMDLEVEDVYNLVSGVVENFAPANEVCVKYGQQNNAF